ncbi:hypothetical protein JTB14_035892 [Gonioctena quinquepunctata]|nr:hypothetical protein JTB14_035892 [Gonioctena quinquepunctata]
MSLRTIIFLLGTTCITVSSQLISATSGSQFSPPESQINNTGKYIRCGSLLLDQYVYFSYPIEPVPFSETKVNSIRSRLEPAKECDFKNVSSNWLFLLKNGMIYNLPQYYDGNASVKEPYSHGPGNYRIVLNVVEQNGSGIGNISSYECIFTITTEKSQPSITGAEDIAIGSGNSFSVDGRQLMDSLVPPKRNKSLIDEWRCDVIRKTFSYFGDRALENDAQLRVPKEHILNGLTFRLALYVETEESNWQSPKQTIRMKREKPHLIINMEENCQADIDVKKQTIFTATCTGICKKMESETGVVWTINVTNINYQKDTLGRKSLRFIIEPNVLKFGKTYQVNVSFEGKRQSGESQILVTQGPTDLSACEIQPKRGIAGRTKFRIDCGDQPKNRNFEILSVKGTIETVLAHGSNLDDLKFSLGTTNRVKFKTPSDKIPTIEELKNSTQERFFDEHSNGSLIGLINSKKHDEAIERLMILADELEILPINDTYDDAVKDYNIKMLDSMGKLPITSGKRAKQLSSLVAQISERYDNMSDPDIAKHTSEMCEKLSAGYQKYIRQASNPKSMMSQVRETTKSFAECVRSNSVPNLEVIKMHDTVNMTSTPFPPVVIPVITEDYPDYGDDQNSSKASSKFAAASDKMVSMCYSSARSLTLAMVVGKMTESSGTKIISQNVKVLVSEDFERYDDKEVSILFCTNRKNPFWWITKQKIFTSVAVLKFIVENEEIGEFEKPFNISFENTEKNFSWIPLHEATTPRRPNDTAVHIREFENIEMFRIDVFSQQGYVVEFLDLKPNDDLDVYISDFVKPTPDEFKEKSTHIHVKNTLLFMPNEHDFNSWHYLCIMPDWKRGNDRVVVKFRVYAMSCFRWQPEERTWVFSCGAAETSTLTRIDCICYQSSVLVGRITSNFVREERTLIFIEHKLGLETNLIIFLSVAVTFFLYCVVLIMICISSEWDNERRLYLLSDLPGFSLNEYFVIVRTGYGFNAGTTSNVVIKLYGTEAATEGHVLNSPDPEKRILQSNQEDWFFLATEVYLGEIEKLEIWFDSAGLKPSWYCSEIEVFDIKKRKYWWFNIKYRFEISTKENYFHTAVPEKLNKNIIFSRKRLSFEGHHFWNLFRQEDATFSKFQRLTIMLSVFMSTYTIILFLYGSPTLSDSDILDDYLEYGFYVQLIWATIGGLSITFLLHLPIVHFFRYPSDGIGCKKDRTSIHIYSNMICWCSLVFLVLVSMTALPVLGFWMPHVTVLLWLTSAVASLLIYIFLLENVIRIVNNFSVDKTRRIAHIILRMQPVLDYMDTQRVFVMKKIGYSSLRPYYEQLYRPLSESRIKKYWAKIRRDLLEIVQDVIMLTIYVVLLYMVVLKDMDPMSRISNREVIDLISGIHSRTMRSGQLILNRQALENYIEYTLIFSMQSPRWYGKFISNDPGITIDNNNKYIGIARLRQHRSDNHSCVVQPRMRFLTKHCISPYADGPEFGDFSEGWGNSTESDKFARMDLVWKYQPAQITGTFSYFGKQYVV